MSLLKAPEESTHLYIGLQQLGLIRQISVVVELGDFEAPSIVREAKLDILEVEITELLHKYFPKTSVTNYACNYKKTLTHLHGK